MTSTTALAALPPPWGSRVLAEGETQAVRFGFLDLWLRAEEGEILVARASLDGGGDPAEGPTGDPHRSPPEDAEWSRFATPAGQRELVLRPCLPDRALVLQPERPFRLLPRAEARIFVRVPLRVRIELPLPEGSRGRVVLDEVPTVSLSDTWWGTFTHGELCYWLPTTARRRMRPELFRPHLAVCPLRMTNRADTDLRVEKLAFRVAHLSLFAEGDHLWGDESRVHYEARVEGSRVEMTGRPPQEARGAVLVTAPAVPVQKGFRARTFDRLRELSSMGGLF